MKRSPHQNEMKHKSFLNTMKQQWFLQLILLLALAYLMLFCYAPMSGLLIAFKDYSISTGFAGFFADTWVGLKWFKEFFSDYMFGTLLRNTIVLSVLKLLIAFPLPILFAIMLNEVRSLPFKKLVQTASYLPHFISWVIVAGICYTMFSTQNGLINEVLMNLGLIDEPIGFLFRGDLYWSMAVGTEVWKETGWSAIIYIAAITGIDSQLYEAAQIDGAGRLQRIRYITLPSIKGTVVLMFILALGGLLGGNMEQALLFKNNFNYEYSQIIQSYVLAIGLQKFRFDYATAIGLLQSIISLILVFGGNWVSRKFLKTSIY